MEKVHSYEEELNRPRIEARARELGIWVSFLGFHRTIGGLKWAIYQEEERRRLLWRLGFRGKGVN